MFVMSMQTTSHMNSYSVNKLAKLSGVSVRTLHHYDKIGLLKPSVRTEAGYRLYGQAELLRLQQILFYRELDMPLKAIREALDSPDFELVAALQSHKAALRAKIDQLDMMLSTIDKTIVQLNDKNMNLTPEALYEGLAPATAKQYRTEATERYGKAAVEDAEQSLTKLGKQGFKKLQADFEACGTRLYQMRHEDPASDRVQAEVANHYQLIRQFWGTTQLPDKQAEAYAGLGQLYVADERFTSVNGKPQPAYADFLSRAMRHFADTRLK